MVIQFSSCFQFLRCLVNITVFKVIVKIALEYDFIMNSKQILIFFWSVKIEYKFFLSDEFEGKILMLD